MDTWPTFAFHSYSPITFLWTTKMKGWWLEQDARVVSYFTLKMQGQEMKSIELALFCLLYHPLSVWKNRVWSRKRIKNFALDLVMTYDVSIESSLPSYAFAINSSWGQPLLRSHGLRLRVNWCPPTRFWLHRRKMFRALPLSILFEHLPSLKHMWYLMVQVIVFQVTCRCILSLFSFLLRFTGSCLRLFVILIIPFHSKHTFS